MNKARREYVEVRTMTVGIELKRAAEVAFAAFDYMADKPDDVGPIDAIRAQPEYEAMSESERESSLKLLHLHIDRVEADARAAARRTAVRGR